MSPKFLKKRIMSMDDYFALASYNALAQGIMGRAKLEGQLSFGASYIARIKANLRSP